MDKLAIGAIFLILFVGYSNAASPFFISAITSALATIPYSGGPMTTGLVGAKLGIGTKLLYYLGYFGRKAPSTPKKKAAATSKLPSSFGEGFSSPSQYMQSGGFPNSFPSTSNFQNSFGGVDPSQLFQALTAQGVDPNVVIEALNYAGSMNPAQNTFASNGAFGTSGSFSAGGGGAGFPVNPGFSSAMPGGAGFPANSGFSSAMPGGAGFPANSGFSSAMPGGAGFPANSGFSSAIPAHQFAGPQGGAGGSLNQPIAPETPASENEPDDAESFFNFLTDMDENTCISRLICDIGNEPSFLGEFSENISSMVSSLKVPPTSRAYKYIEIMERGKQEGQCNVKFPECGDVSYEVVKNIAPSVSLPQNVNPADINF
ncbi:uncharacterized PE-PGRS family protein PE_PGRS10-like [Parasteatoda tepidariorum]|uniref:uncharacterized PE-PGRS family protein PE_PGRS10-like n=1 Tax=Parasteatoda tepidariorum TaxID=114398 RepID=UPI001C71C4B3|nr:fibroin heavy chain-like isoform X1 [Parasteatoda tepidariorum]XP_042910148.1 fibroin heavy chain-like isoform X1 [Parasteatoda tepidariorum]